MIRCPLSALLTAALGTAALSSVLAQGTATQSKSTPASTKSAAKPTPPPSTKKPAPKPTAKVDVVGTVYNQQVTWDQLLDRMHNPENLADLNGSLAQVVASDAAETFFGKNPKDTFTITRAKAFADLRQHPSQKLVQVLEMMLTMKAIDFAATRENVQPTVKDVNDKVADVLKELRAKGVIPPNESDEQFLKEHDMTIEKLRINYRPQVQVLNLVRKQTTKNLGHPIGPADLIQASHILIRVPDPSATATSDEKAKADADALKKIQGILADIRASKSPSAFADAAKAQSDDGSKANGGDLGIFMHGMMVPEFENAAFAAKPNVVTDPVKTKFGYHIILVTKTGNQLTPAERQKFIEDYLEKQVPTYVQTLRDDGKILDKLEALLPKQQAPTFGPGGARPGVRPGGIRPSGAPPAGAQSGPPRPQ